VAILGLCLGNLYSHSFIIRDNLLLLCVFMALAYSHAYPQSIAFASPPVARCKLSGKVVVLIALIIVLTIPYAITEVASSFNRLPFQRATNR
jgi:hypothetical protein